MADQEKVVVIRFKADGTQAKEGVDSIKQALRSANNDLALMVEKFGLGSK